jgi:6-phosphogluconolactonase
MSSNGAVTGVNHLSVFRNAGEVAAAAEAFVVTKLEQSIGEGRDVDLVLAGGSTPRALYERMARSDRTIDWSHVRLWLEDER